MDFINSTLHFVLSWTALGLKIQSHTINKYFLFLPTINQEPQKRKLILSENIWLMKIITSDAIVR